MRGEGLERKRKGKGTGFFPYPANNKSERRTKSLGPKSVCTYGRGKLVRFGSQKVKKNIHLRRGERKLEKGEDGI